MARIVILPLTLLALNCISLPLEAADLGKVIGNRRESFRDIPHAQAIWQEGKLLRPSGKSAEKAKNFSPAMEEKDVYQGAKSEEHPTDDPSWKPYFERFKEEFFPWSRQEGDKPLIGLGGMLQVDYRYYDESQRADNRFDIRRARLSLGGWFTEWCHYYMLYEFEGINQDELLDAYGELTILGTNYIRVGQFKEPFSLEWVSLEKGLWFAERSIGYSLGPRRDVGVMVHGSLLKERIYYAGGLFNGDGIDGSSRGTQSDTPEVAGRLVLAPFRSTSWEWLESLQFGGSGGIANIDLANVDLEVKSTGMVGTNRNLYVLNANTKFGVLQNVDQRRRFGLEAAWAWGPVGLQGEYFYLGYTDLKPAGSRARDADFSAWYASAILCLTGEHPRYSDGVFEPLVPKEDFRLGGSGFGALALSVRVEHFEGDKDWITEDAFVSVREADAFSVALSWILNPYVRLIVDYSQTDLSDPVRVRVEPDGDVDFIEEEQVVTVRLSMSL